IFPSIVMSVAISDSLRGRLVVVRGTSVVAGLGASSGFDGASNRAGSFASEGGAGVCRAVLSFQRDMALGYRDGWFLRLALNPGDVLVIVTFSGGGTRAAALAYGTLEALRDVTLKIGGRPRRLLDEVDIINAVSGGSIVAAYYAVHRDRIFRDFESKFLYRDV